MRRPLFQETCPAEPVDLQDVGKDLSLDISKDRLLQLFFRAEGDILHLSAGHADEMVMVRFVPAEIIIELSVRVDHPRDDASPVKLVEIAVYGGKPQSAESLLHPFPDIFRAQIYPFLIEDLEHGDPLWSGLEAESPKYLVKIPCHYTLILMSGGNKDSHFKNSMN